MEITFFTAEQKPIGGIEALEPASKTCVPLGFEDYYFFI
jgi:hypothetical protein